MADNVIETGRSRIEDILLKASNGEALSRIEEILLSLYQDLVHLDDQGLIPASLLPPQVFEHCEVVVDDTARFALTQDDVQNGDLVYVNSSQTMYFVLDDTKLDREAGYLPLAAGVAAKAIADEYGNNISQTYATKQELGGKQDAIDTTHKLSADLVDDTNTTHKFATAAQLDQINTNKNNILSKCAYCTCSTSGSTAAKVVDAPTGWVLQDGCIIGIKNTNTNTVNNVTLNVNNTGAKSIAYGSNTPYTGMASRVCGLANQVTFYMYDGTYWRYITTNRIDSEMPQSEATAGTSTEPRLITAKVLSNTIDEKLVPIENNISITDITSHFIAEEGYTIQSGISAVYRQGKHIFGTLSIKIDSGNLPTTLTTIALNVTDTPNSGILMSCGCGVDEMSIDSIGTCYYNNFRGVIQCKDTVSTNTCFNLHLDFIAI